MQGEVHGDMSDLELPCPRPLDPLSLLGPGPAFIATRDELFIFESVSEILPLPLEKRFDVVL